MMRVSTVYLFVLLTVCTGLGGCGEPTSSPSVVQDPEGPTAAQVASDLEKKAALGDSDAQFQLGEAYFHGKGVAKNANKAEEWYLKAASQGLADAQNMLGWMYLYGNGVPQDLPKALEWFQKASAQGLAAGQFFLGLMHEVGDAVPKNMSKALEWYQKAAAQGFAPSQHRLGVLYGDGKGVPKDMAKALDWMQKSAAQGFGPAQAHLGWRYFQGEGVPKDAAKALAWFEKAAAQGNAYAQNSLGWVYSRGEGVPKDDVKATEWFEKAAMQGFAEAQDRMGLLSKDTVVAYAWFNLAVAAGHTPAIQMRNLLERGLSRAEIAEAQRLSSGWKKGQTLVRDNVPATSGVSSASTPGALTKSRTGSLFVVGKAGHAVTNQHVVEGCAELRIDGREGAAKKLTEDLVNDLALLQIPGEVLATAPIAADPAKLRQGSEIVVFGFPLNAVLSSGGNLTPGVVSALTGLGNNTNQIQITAAIQPGSSGSPVLNRKGEVVGVVSMKLDDAKMARATGQVGQNVNFAINGQTLKTFLETHKVVYRTGRLLSFEKSGSALADEARRWTLVVECWK